MESSNSIKLYLENRLTEYGYSKEMTPSKYNAYQGAYRVAMIRMGYVGGGHNKISIEQVEEFKKLIDEILPPSHPEDMIDGLPRHSKIGANHDWTLTRNACGTPMCVKRLGQVGMRMFRNLNDDKFTLYLANDPYTKDGKEIISLSSIDWESAANEADDSYRAMMTKMIEFATEQIQNLPDV